MSTLLRSDCPLSGGHAQIYLTPISLTGALQLRGSVQGKGGLKIHVLPKMTTAIVC